MVYLHVLLLILMISSSANCTQIIPYNPPEIIKPFHEKTREFFLGGREWNVMQDWEHAGVAGVVWEAALELGNYLGSNPSLVVDKRVIELGAGTGLVGMVAGHLGAHCVDITDRNIEFARLNLKNNLPNDQRVSVVPYEWGEPATTPLALPYDLVLGSDIIYIEDTYDLLVQSLKHLCTRDTVVLFASKLRYSKVQNFMKMLEEKFDSRVINNNEKHGIYIYRVVLKV